MIITKNIRSDEMTNIKVFFDFACPFSYIGFAIGDRLRKEKPSIHFQWYPYELNPETPKEGMDLTKKVEKKKAEEGYQRIERLGQEYGLIYNNTTTVYNTNRVHKAALYARDQEKFYSFAEKAFQVNFQEGKNFGKKEIINAIGEEVGLDIEDMNKAIDSGKYDKEMEKAKELQDKYHVNSVPTFIVNEDRNVTYLKEYQKFKEDLLR